MEDTNKKEATEKQCLQFKSENEDGHMNETPEVLLTDSDTTTFDILVQRYAHLLRGLDDGYTERQVTDALDDIFQLLGHQIVPERVEILARLGNLNAKLVAKCLEKCYSETASALIEATDSGGLYRLLNRPNIEHCGSTPPELNNAGWKLVGTNNTNIIPEKSDFTPAFMKNKPSEDQIRPQSDGRPDESDNENQLTTALISVSLDSIGRWRHRDSPSVSTHPVKSLGQPEVYLLGDSIVRGVRIQLDGPSNSITWCYPDTILQRVTSRIPHLLPGTRSEHPIVVLHAGTNDLGMHPTEEIIRHLEALVNEVMLLRPGARVVLSAVLPRYDVPASWRPRLDFRQDVRVGWAAKVAEVVDGTRELCRKEAVRFVDAGGVMSASRSNYAGDGLHLSLAGTVVLSAVLSDAVKRMLRE